MVVARRKLTDNKKTTRARPAKGRILDAAERLFAQHGFYGVSVRDITDAAGVDVALVSYHFGGKRELFTAVFQRRAELLNAERLEMLEGVRRAAHRLCFARGGVGRFCPRSALARGARIRL